MLDFNPFLTVWTRPRETVRAIVAENPALHVTLIACLVGVDKSLDRAMTRNAGDQLPLSAILGIACILGPLGGLFSFWLSSHLIRWTGTWLGGTAPRQPIKTAIAWASIPTVLTLLSWIVELALFGHELFKKETKYFDTHHPQAVLFVALAVIETALSIWSFILLCKMVAEVQGFRSAWRGFGNVFLAGIVIAVPIFVIALCVILLLAVGISP